MTDLAAGEIVRVRSRQYLIEDVVFPSTPTDATLVSLSCLEDDALGEKLEVLWEKEIDAKLIGKTSWEVIANRGFDHPRLFSAYLHTLRWNCVTSTDPKLFQAPYRAGIEVKAYQLEPLRKALLMPRVSLFIADDVGLGKTIEAGLILREMLMRQKVRRVVISCPPSVVRQWQQEMETRFGLNLIIFDREFMASRRQERGYGINPWTTHNRFIISHALLRDETYAAPLRDWLGDFSSGSMLILDEAHNAAPASGSRYAVDSQLTRTLRDIAPRFEHKLFLSATPHNGHSNSFAALLEILDPQRFCRGVPVRDRRLLDTVMVRRLKQDLREIGEEFPQRRVIPVIIDHLPDNAPELQLSRLLQEYRQLREERLQTASKSTQNAAILVITSLQKRLLSSIEAFARTLKVHRAAMEKKLTHSATQINNLPLLRETPGADDERAELAEEEIQAEEENQLTLATAHTVDIGLSSREWQILEQMTDIANQARYQPDPRVKELEAWIKQHLCPNLGQPNAPWLNRRVIIFTEYIDTKNYLKQQLQTAILGSHADTERLEVFHGGIVSEDRRDAIKNAFNSDPAHHPLRILIATDAAREGVNLQNNCADLFHFDIPWNPSRMEQRNGRIDRKLQKADVVNCYYFVLAQRPEDQVLKVLVKKTQTIHQELGTLSPVLQKNLSQLLETGIRHHQLNHITTAIEKADLPNLQVSHTELEANRQRREQLTLQLSQLQEMLKKSRDWLGLSDEHFRQAISASLEILGTTALTAVDPAEVIQDTATARWKLPELDQSTDPTWVNTLDTLRTPRQKAQKPWEWRKVSPIRPVVFRDPGSLDGEVVHLHLEHRLVQRLLGRFLSQGFLHNELTRACVCLTDDPMTKIIALGRLSIYGEGASRLHDEVMAIAAEWSDPATRGRKKLQPLKLAEKDNVLGLLETSLIAPRLQKVPETVKQILQKNAPQDIAELIPHLERRGEDLAQRAQKKLTARGQAEAAQMKAILQAQQQRIQEHQQEIAQRTATQLNIPYAEFPLEEKQQLEADSRYWEKRLKGLAEEINSEPPRIEASYQIKAMRIEPVGLIYLWPVSG